jgi:ABC-2 type transport system permease protein
MPLFFATILLISSTTTSGFLMSGLVEEKTNRVIEVLVTSVTPMQLLTGKIVGLFLLGLTQILILLVIGFVGVVIAQQSDSTSSIVFPLDLVVLGIIYYLLSYFILASVMAGVGAIAGSEQESRQLSVFITLPFILPLFFIVNFFMDPNGNLAVFLSLFPLTAPMAVLMRVGITAVPAWQIILSILLMVITSVVLVWAAAKIFRWGLLLYGKRLNPLELLRVLLRRNPPAMVTSVPQSNEGNTP